MKSSKVDLTLSQTLCRKHGVRILVLFTILLAIPLATAAQITTSTLLGTISDPGGAQVPSASVTARNIDTGLTRTVQSSADGSYRLEFLPVGNYVIEVTPTSGFKKALRSGIVLQVSETVRVEDRKSTRLNSSH